MSPSDHIRNPMEWTVDQIKTGGEAIAQASHAVVGSDRVRELIHPEIAHIGVADLKDSLARGFNDFAAYRSDVIFICLIYPLAGLVLAWLTFGYATLPLLFPLASGFALLGPVAAVGLYEISKRREQGVDVTWADAFGVVRSPAFGAIFVLGLVLAVIFVAWMAVAYVIYQGTLGPEPPTSIGSFVNDVLTTGPGWAMIIIGCGLGFLFAGVVLTISVVSFPLLLDRDVGLLTAVKTSIRAVAENPRTMAIWGMIVAGGLVIGSAPVLLGLILVMPVLGHATWHLYRKLVRL